MKPRSRAPERARWLAASVIVRLSEEGFLRLRLWFLSFLSFFSSCLITLQHCARLETVLTVLLAAFLLNCISAERHLTRSPVLGMTRLTRIKLIQGLFPPKISLHG